MKEYVTIQETSYIFQKCDSSNNPINRYTTTTYTGYKKTHVLKELEKSILNEQIEPALYWCAELVCSELFLDLWNILIHILGKHISLGNPKLAFLMEQRFIQFREWIRTQHILRNHLLTRELFAEIVSIFVFSQKRSPLISQKITKEDIEYSNLSLKLKAKDTNEFDTFFDKKDDALELYIPLNEWFNALFIEKNPHLACYWIDWLLFYEQQCSRKKQIIKMKKRKQNYIQEKYSYDFIWFLWDCILKKTSGKQKKIVNSLLTLFQIHYTTPMKRKRKYILYFACLFLYQPTIDTPLCPLSVSPLVSKIYKVYEKIQKQQPEHSIIKYKNNDKLNYLFMNII